MPEAVQSPADCQSLTELLWDVAGENFSGIPSDSQEGYDTDTHAKLFGRAAMLLELAAEESDSDLRLLKRYQRVLGALANNRPPATMLATQAGVEQFDSEDLVIEAGRFFKRMALSIAPPVADVPQLPTTQSTQPAPRAPRQRGSPEQGSSWSVNPPEARALSDTEINDLVRAATSTDERTRLRAREDLIKALRPMIIAGCRSRLTYETPKGNFDDVVQEVCMAAINGLESFQLDGRPFRAYVWSIISYKLVDTYRAHGRNRSYAVDEFPDDMSPVAPISEQPEEQFLQHEGEHFVNHLLAGLTARQRQILTLRIIDDMSAIDVASILQATPGSVRVAQHRALNQLRNLLREQDSE